jgi:hypothetical protein
MNELKEMPFYNLTNIQFINTVQSINQRINNILNDNKFQNFINQVTHEGQNKKSSCNYHDEDSLLCEMNRTNYDLKVLHINIRSLDKHGGELIAMLNALDNKFDVIALTEIGKNNVPNVAAMLSDVYNVECQLPSIKCGGAALLVKKDIQYKERKDLQVLDNSLESVWIELFKNNEKIVIGCIYRHPNGDLSTFTNLLEFNVSKLNKENSRCVICGDLNIDALKVEYHNPTNNFMNMLMVNNFIPQITLPTRITENSVTLIDHIIIKTQFNNIYDYMISGNIYYDISDHLPNFLLLQFNQPTKINDVKNRPFVRIFGKNNLNKFHDVMLRENWTEIYNEKNPTAALQGFLSRYSKHFEECFPLKRISRKRSKDKKWVTNGLLKCIHYKNKLYRSYLHNPSLANKVIYTKYRNALTKCLRKAEDSYYAKLIDDNKKNIRAMWQIFGPIIKNKKSDKIKTITSLLIDKQEITDKQIIANKFNEHFTSIANNLVKNIPKTDDYNKYLKTSMAKNMFLMPTDTNEIKSIINRLNNNKATGPDNIHVKNVKLLHDILSPILCHITNTCFTEGDFPSQLKLARVIPIHKRNEYTNPSNYRPISLLSCLSKIVEKVINTRLVNFLNHHNILYPYQFGFRENHSTEMALIEIIENIRNNIDHNYYTGGIFIDLTKAFDLVNHSILLAKLNHYGIRGNVNKLFENYLKNRTQYVQIDKCKSQINEVTCGVPQGTVLGPILFLIYINDLPNSTNGQIRLFADDTSLFLREKDPHQLKQHMQIELEKLCQWFTSNRLIINAEKTQFSIYCRKNKHIPDELNILSINNINLLRSHQVKYLGITVDENLNWRNHITNLEKSLIKIVRTFHLVKNWVPRNIKLKIYHAYIHSKIKYGICIYGAAGTVLLNKIQRLQNRAIKTLFNLDFYTPTKNLLFDFKLLSVKDLYKQTISEFVFKQRLQLLPTLFQNYFSTNDKHVPRSTRQSKLLKIYKIKTQQAIHSIRYAGPKIWNELTKELDINCTKLSPQMFKTIVKSNFINRYQN